MANIVVIYYALTAKPLRGTIREHIYSFQNHGGHRTYYVNAAARRIPSFLFSEPIDLVVLATTFLAYRWGSGINRFLRRHDEGLRRLPGIKIALPQDEFLRTDDLVHIINEYDVRHVFSVAPPSEWPLIYRGVDFSRVSFHHVLTGYLDDETVARINALAGREKERTIDIGYRAYEARPWLGRHGMLKKQVADVIGPAAANSGLNCDISLRKEDTILGDDWLSFLLRCRFTIGVEGGASILDRDGSVRNCVEEHMGRHPEAPFDEVERQCFPGLDGALQLFALSPRHLETCATRTGQVLVEGDYNGVLEAGRHYISIRKDFSNLEDVIAKMKDEDLRKRMVDASYEDIVSSGRYTYRSFVDFVVRASVGEVEPRPVGLRFRLSAVADAVTWLGVRSFVVFRDLMWRILPRPAMELVRAMKRRIVSG